MLLQRNCAILVFILVNYRDNYFEETGEQLMNERDRNLKFLKKCDMDKERDRKRLLYYLQNKKILDHPMQRQINVLNMLKGNWRSSDDVNLSMRSLSLAPRAENKEAFEKDLNWRDGKLFHDGMVWYQKKKIEPGDVEPIIALLKARVGKPSFRAMQLEAVYACAKKKNILCILPTGFGKTLIYIMSGLVARELKRNNKSNNSAEGRAVTIVISPLVSLIENQTRKLEKLELLPYAYRAGKNLRDDRFDILNGYYSYILLTPEKLMMSPATQALIEELVKKKRVSRFVIDEAHCISHTGRDFRPSYKALRELMVRYSEVPVLALTATANNEITEDIIKIFNMKRTLVFRGSMSQPNLTYKVIEKKGRCFIIFFFVQRPKKKPPLIIPENI